jgi:hypothetical protein
MSKILEFWVDVEYERIKNHQPGRPKTELLAQIIRKFEEAGDAMRCLNTKGEIAWKTTLGCFRDWPMRNRRPGTMSRIGSNASGDMTEIGFARGTLNHAAASSSRTA